MLDFAIENGILDLGTIQNIAMMKRRENYLAMHNRKIWLAKNGYWYTELPGREPGTRRLVKKKKREDIDNAIISFYEEQSGPPTFEKCFQEWLKEKLEYNEIGLGTAERYRQDYNRFIKGTGLDEMKMDIIKEEFLEDFIRRTIASQKLTAKAYSKMRTIIMGAFKYAKKKHYTFLSISAFFGDLDISPKAFTKTVKKKQVFDETETQKIGDLIRENPTVMNYGILLAFQTGIRSGELAALKFDDVEGNWLHIQRQEIKYREEGEKHYRFEVVDYTKTDAGDRRIALPPQALDTIAKLRELNPDGEYIMQTADGKMKKDSFNRKLYRVCTNCGVEKKSMHKIRKTYGTQLLNSGADDIFTTRQMGHADVSTTRKCYYDIDKTEQRYLEEVKKAIRI